ncbi:MAG: ABC transporter permease [Candidatus Caldatribacteriota bacterium]
MRFFILAYKNLKRRKLRSFLTIGGVAVAVAVLVSLLGFNAGYQDALTSDVDKMGYHVVVTAKGCPYEAATMILNGEAGLRFIDESIYNQITNDSEIDKITPFLASLTYDPQKMDGKGGFTNYLGIEESYLQLKPEVDFLSGEWFSGEDVYEVILGYDAAETEKKSVGDKISIPGKDIILVVVGVFKRTATQEDGVIFLPLKTAQRIFEAEGKLTGIGIKLKQIEKIAEFEERLYPLASIQVISMSQVKGTILNLVNSAKILIMSVAFIAIIVAIIGVINTILMSVFERTQEIGIMKAIGASKLDIFKLIWIETLIVCTLGGILGSIIAILGGNLVEYLVRKVMPYAPGGKLLLITPDLLVYSFLGVIIVGIISGLFPAIKAASMRPIEVIRSGE